MLVLLRLQTHFIRQRSISFSTWIVDLKHHLLFTCALLRYDTRIYTCRTGTIQIACICVLTLIVKAGRCCMLANIDRIRFWQQPKRKKKNVRLENISQSSKRTQNKFQIHKPDTDPLFWIYILGALYVIRLGNVRQDKPYTGAPKTYTRPIVWNWSTKRIPQAKQQCTRIKIASLTFHSRHLTVPAIRHPLRAVLDSRKCVFFDYYLVRGPFILYSISTGRRRRRCRCRGR